jgi:transcriptional regulator GlxA family with amidase domain
MVRPLRIGFLVVRLFPMYVLMLAADALRLANKYAVQRKFDWVLVSDDGRPVEASNGIRMDCEAAVDQAQDFDYAFVLAGDDQTRALTRRIRQWVLRVDRSNAVLGAIDSGAFLLAECRVVRQRALTVHPGAAAAFRERYPDVTMRPDPVVRDGRLVTCAGGLAVLNMMLSLIDQHCGAAVAQSVADDMVVRGEGAGGPPTPRAHNQKSKGYEIDDIIRLMEQSLEEPLSLAALSSRVGLSRRQMTRQFQASLGRSPMDYYRTLRLTHAKQLVFQSDLAMSKIAAAVGFQSLSAFSRCFAAEFGCSPRKLLMTLRKEGNSAAVPAGNRFKRLPLRG